MSGNFHQIEQALGRVDEHRDDADGLLRALHPYKDVLRPLAESFRRGMLLWSMAGLLDELASNPTQLSRMLPGPSTLPPDVNALLARESVLTASLVFRTWVSAVYMRSDLLIKFLRSADRTSVHLSAYIDLLTSDEIRHLRNSISHGTFDAEFGRFLWRDRDASGELAYELLRRLNDAIFTLWLSVSAVSFVPPGADISHYPGGPAPECG